MKEYCFGFFDKKKKINFELNKMGNESPSTKKRKLYCIKKFLHTHTHTLTESIEKIKMHYS